MVCDGVQTMIPGSLTSEELRAERRRCASEIGLMRLERESRSVLCGKRRVKAWRVKGEPEFEEHARLVKMLAAAFSG